MEIKAIIAKTKPLMRWTAKWISTAQSVGDLIGLIVGQEFRDYKLLKYLVLAKVMANKLPVIT